MNRGARRQLSFYALMASAVIFGVVLASSMNWTPVSLAQKTSSHAVTHAAPGALPNFADIAADAMPSVVSITTTDIVKGPQRRFVHPPIGGDEEGQDPFEYFFGNPRPGPPHSGGPPLVFSCRSR